MLALFHQKLYILPPYVNHMISEFEKNSGLYQPVSTRTKVQYIKKEKFNPTPKQINLQQTSTGLTSLQRTAIAQQKVEQQVNVAADYTKRNIFHIPDSTLTTNPFKKTTRILAETPIDMAAGIAVLPGRMYMGGQALFSKKGRTVSKQAVKEAPVAFAKQHDPRSISGAVNLALLAGVVEGGVKFNIPKPKVTTYKVTKPKIIKPKVTKPKIIKPKNKIIDLDKEFIEWKIGPQTKPVLSKYFFQHSAQL